MGFSPAIRFFMGTLLALVLAACSIQLAPLYDQKIVDSVSAANVKALTLFSALERGSPQAQFPQFSARYDEVIGAFDALRIETAARPIPPLIGHLGRARGLEKACAEVEGGIASCVNSSPLWLARIVDRLGNMRDLHRSRGLAWDRVALAKVDYEGWMLNLMTIETALKR